MNHTQKQQEKEYKKSFREFKYKSPNASEDYFINRRIRIVERYLLECEETAEFAKGTLMDGVEIVDGVFTNNKMGTEFEMNMFYEELKFFKNKLKELTEPKQPEPTINKNPYPLIFEFAEVYHKFIEYTSKIDSTDFYKSYSYLKKRLEAEKLIRKQSDNDFMYFIYNDLGLISKEQHQEYLIFGQLKSADKTKGKGRKINFDNTFSSLCL